MSPNWQDKIKHAPHAPGVYIMKDGAGKMIYVGKANNLKSRVRAYLNKTDARFMIPFLTSKIASLDFIITGTEKEALILENNLIKEYGPRYNVDLRDDKTYFSIRIDRQHSQFPRFQLVRQVGNDGARYFGPYPSSSAAKETLCFLQSIFPLRTCSDRGLKNHGRPCLEYQIKRCLAPCAGFVDKSDYDSLVRDSISFLEGREKWLLSDLSSRMKKAAMDLHFEEAGLLRDRVSAIRITLEKQRIVSGKFKDQDVFGLYREGDQTQIQVFHIRKGKLLGEKAFPLISLRTESEEILSSLITQYYHRGIDIPAEIILPCPLEDGAVIADWLRDKKMRKVSLMAPKKGRLKDLIMMANHNAENIYKADRQGQDNRESALQQLKEKLRLNNIPKRIECFDISNVSGKYAVGSMVTFASGRTYKDGYRRYRIQNTADMDDYAMMREVLVRRYRTQENLPDLVVLDGGKGQLNVAVVLFRDLGIDGVDIISLAKKKPETPPSSINKTEDRVYLPKLKEPVYISRWPHAYFLLQQLRDEAHRFALAYHHTLKKRADFHSLLNEIPGVGAAKKKELLIHFGALSKIKTASIDELQKVKGIGRTLGDVIHRFLNNNGQSLNDLL